MLPITHWHVKVQEIGEDITSNMFLLSTLNCWSFIEHISWSSKLQLPKFPSMRFMSLDNEMMCHELEPWVLMGIAMGFDVVILCKYGLLLEKPLSISMRQIIWALLGFKGDLPKIHDNIDVVRVANKIIPCGVKNLSSTMGQH